MRSLRGCQIVSYMGFMVAFCLLPLYAVAAPPTQLYGKSIMIRWGEDRDVKYVDGETKHVVVDAAEGIYVSTRGRVFQQTGRSARGTDRLGSNASGYVMGSSRNPQGGELKTGNSRYHTILNFQGRTVIGTTLLDSGARRLTINLDESFRTCTAEVVFGKEGGVPGVVVHGISTRLTVVQVKVSSPSCKITDGNIFGENAE